MIAPTSIDFLIGVDGGGTGTRVRLTDAAGRLLGEGSAGPSALRRGAAAAWAAIDDALAHAFAAARLERAEPARCAIGLGLAGAGVPEWERAFLAAAPAYARLVLRNDALTAVLGAHGGASGAVLIAGTGSVLAVLDRQRHFRLAGGFGFPVGDEGSGAWIGALALRHAQHALERRDAGGALAQAVRARCGAGRGELTALGVGADATALAALAPLVFDHAAHDGAAGRILDEAADELAALARALDEGKGPAEPPLPLVLAGSVAQALAGRLAQRLSDRSIVPPQADAATGAWRLVADAALAQVALFEPAIAATPAGDAPHRPVWQVDIAGPADWPAWLALRQALWPDTPEAEHRAEMATWCRDDGHTVALLVRPKAGEAAGRMAGRNGATAAGAMAISSTAAIGFAEVALRRDYVNGCDHSPVGYLEGLYVRPEARRGGAARALVEAGMAWAAQRGAAEFASDALLVNRLSQAVHRALGFEGTDRVAYFRRLLPKPPTGRLP